ncbi:LPXTG cell wall anchor domain-containing protein [Streptomyces sp. NPDC018045]|uniref:LPXTG cell wall anchor domain-containing protein n=1 Tax=Streptomyces sp. NPDC018045 TaxID=3365037 RepID=UPI0037A67C90
MDSRTVSAAHHRPSSSAVTPAGGKGRQVAQRTEQSALAQTGSGHVGAAAATSAALLLGGAVLIRRSRTSRP